MVKRLNAILKPGGRLLVYVPAFQFLYSSRDRKVGHYCRYRRGRLRSLAQAAGMEINRLEYCDPLGFFAAIAYRLRDHGDGRLSEAKVRFFDKYLFPLSPPLQPLLRRVLGQERAAGRNEAGGYRSRGGRAAGDVVGDTSAADGVSERPSQGEPNLMRARSCCTFGQM